MDQVYQENLLFWWQSFLQWCTDNLEIVIQGRIREGQMAYVMIMFENAFPKPEVIQALTSSEAKAAEIMYALLTCLREFRIFLPVISTGILNIRQMRIKYGFCLLHHDYPLPEEDRWINDLDPEDLIPSIRYQSYLDSNSGSGLSKKKKKGLRNILS